MSNPFSGVGTVFGRASTQAGPFTAIAQINNIGGPDKTRNTIDTTSLDTADGYKTFIAGFRDAGQVTLAMNFTRAGYELLNDDFESDVAVWYQIALPDTENTKLTFLGLVTNLGSSIPAEDKVTASATIKISGKAFLTYEGTGGTTFS